MRGNRIIVDTDAGFDDLIAVHCLLRSASKPAAPLVTTVGGVLPAPTAGALLRGLFPDASIALGRTALHRRFSLDDPIPEWLMQYRSKTLKDFSQAMKIHPIPTLPDENPLKDHHREDHHESLRLVMDLMDSNNSSSENNEKVDILCLGPLSNLAHWLDHYEQQCCNNQDDKHKDQQFASKINRIFILGGNHPQSNAFTKENPEFNFSLDPEAVQRVFQSSWLRNKLHLVPTTVSDRTCLKTKLGESHVEEFVQQMRNSNDHFLGKVLAFDTLGYSLSCDPVCAYALEHPDCVQWEQVSVNVDTSSGLLMAIDESSTSEQQSGIQIATDIDLKGYLSWLCA